MKKLIFSVVILIFASVSIFGNGDSEGTPGVEKYAIIVKNVGNPYNEKEISGFQEAVKELVAKWLLKPLVNLQLKSRYK